MATYADRPWLKHYDPGVPHTLKPYPEIPVYKFLQDNAQKQPNATALIASAKVPVVGRQATHITYAQLDRMSDALACGLLEMGLKKGDRVALILPNSVQFAVSYFGILKAGGVVAACNPTYPAEKMAYQINDCDAEIVITLSPYYKMLNAIRSRTQVKRALVTNIKEYFPTIAKALFTVAKEKKDGHRIEKLEAGDVLFQDVLEKYDGQKPNVEVKASDVAIFQYTGGTTGTSKGAMGTHFALVVNTLQMASWLSPDNYGVMDEKLMALGAIPMFHVYGMVVVLGLVTAKGGSIVLVPNARDVDEVVDVIDHFKPALFSGVPALFNALVNHPRVRSGEASLKSIKLCSSGSAPLAPATKREFEQFSGTKLPEGYGMSEAPTGTNFNPILGVQKINSVGLPLPDVELRIVNLEDSATDVPVGEEGELIMHTPNLMLGYHKMPDETAKTLRQLADGKTWLFTGDIAKMDEDGYFYIVDRKKDMALIGGFNVYPANIERVLRDHPAVSEVGVAAIPHPEKEGQEALKAWIVLKPEHKSDDAKTLEKELLAHCEKYLAGYEVPRRFAFIDALPKSEVLKTLRRELIRMELEAQQAAKVKA